MARPKYNQLYPALLALFCFFTLFCTVIFSSPFPAFAFDSDSEPQSIFIKEDPVGDEKGPGTYGYPHSPVFNPRKGLFDLTKFEILEDNENYYFRLTIGVMSNPWGAPEGFSQQRIAIYIDSVPNQGRTETFREGAFVEFGPRNGWEYLVDILGWKHSRVYYYTDERSSGGEKGLEVKVLPGTKTIQTKVPKKLLDNHPKTWEVYVLVGAQDGLGPDNYRQVLKKPTEWQFGGGTDTYYDPNVLDLLDPFETEYSQKQMLSSYNVAQGKYAVLYPVVLADVPEGLPTGSIWWRSTKAVVTAQINALNKAIPWEYYYPVYIAIGVAVVLVILLIVVNLYRYIHPE